MRPVRGEYYVHVAEGDYGCPIVCFSIHRGVTEKTDPDLSKDEAANIALEWAAQTFGEEFIWGLLSAWDRQEMVKDDADYVRGYAIGLEAVKQLCPRDPS